MGEENNSSEGRCWICIMTGEVRLYVYISSNMLLGLIAREQEWLGTTEEP
jgi:hypothetical protein